MWNEFVTNGSQEGYMNYFMVCLGLGRMDACEYLNILDWEEE